MATASKATGSERTDLSPTAGADSTIRGKREKTAEAVHELSGYTDTAANAILARPTNPLSGRFEQYWETGQWQPNYHLVHRDKQ